MEVRFATNRNTVLITGITVQDGSYESDLLLKNGFTEHGIKWRSSCLNTEITKHFTRIGMMRDSAGTGPLLVLNCGDLRNSTKLTHINQQVLILALIKRTRIYQASTWELCGLVQEIPQKESTLYDPRSPFPFSKAAGVQTYGLPVVLTNCSNNCGHWKLPEKLIPVVVLKAAAREPIPLYGGDLNMCDLLHVEDHVDALLLAPPTAA